MQPKRRIITDGVLSAIVLRRVAPAPTVMGGRRWSDWRGLCFVLSDKLLASLRTLCARVETLRHLEYVDLLLPGQQKHYEQTLEDAYAALAQVETALDKLGQELEYQHQRLGGAVEHYAQGEGTTLLWETRPEAPDSQR